MRLPQSNLQPHSFLFHHSLTFTIALLVAGFIPAGAAAASAQLACSPSTLRFGEVDTGHTQTLLVTLTNNGTTSATLSGISVSSSRFVTSSLSLPLVLSAGASVDLNVSFTPESTGWIGGNVKFTSNAPNPTLSLNVAGTGVASEAVTASPATLSFGSVAAGSTSTLPLVITNAQSSKVTITSVEIGGPNFSLAGANFPLTLESGQSLSLNATFSPQAPGEIGGSFLLKGPGLNIPATGTGTAATQYSVNLSWNSSGNVEGYNVYRSTKATGAFSRINSTLNPNTAYTDSTVAAGQTYYYEATSVNSSGAESPRSTPAVEVAVP
jgi:hypothetical protein